MKKIFISTLISLTTTLYAQENIDNYSLSCESHQDNQLDATFTVNFGAPSKDYRVQTATLLLPKAGLYNSVDQKTVAITERTLNRMEFLDGLDFVIQDEDLARKVEMVSLYQVHFGRMSTLYTFSARHTLTGDGVENREVSDVTCKLSHF